MSFINNGKQGNNRLSAYVFTMAIVMICYAVIGQLPMVIDLALSKDPLNSLQNADISTLSLIFGKNKLLFYLLLPFVLFLIALLISVRIIHKRRVMSVITGRKKFDFKRFFFSFFLWGSIMGLSLWASVSQSDKIKWNYNPDTFWILCLISVVFITLQTIAEEVLFRGYLLQGIVVKTKNVWVAVISTSILFGLMHAANPEIEVLGYGVLFYYILTGFFLGYIAMKDNGLELSMGYHAINNIFASVFLTNDWQAFQTDALFKDYSAPVFGLENILTLVILQPLLLFIFSKVYKWEKSTN